MKQSMAREIANKQTSPRKTKLEGGSWFRWRSQGIGNRIMAGQNDDELNPTKHSPGSGVSTARDTGVPAVHWLRRRPKLFPPWRPSADGGLTPWKDLPESNSD